MFKNLYKDYPQASQFHSTAPKKVREPSLRLNQTVPQMVYRNQFIFLPRPQLHPVRSLQALPWSSKPRGECVRPAGPRSPNPTGKGKSKMLWSSLLKMQKHPVPWHCLQGCFSLSCIFLSYSVCSTFLYIDKLYRSRTATPSRLSSLVLQNAGTQISKFYILK